MARIHPGTIAIGKHKGHPITKFKRAQKKGKQPVKPASTKGRLGKRVALIRQIVSEISGVAPYEKRTIELLKIGGVKESKKALKVVKKALGTHKRGKVKRESLMSMLRNQQAAQKKKEEDKKKDAK